MWKVINCVLAVILVAWWCGLAFLFVFSFITFVSIFRKGISLPRLYSPAMLALSQRR